MREILMQPVAGPRAWRGEALARETSWSETLSAPEVADIERALATAKASGRSVEEVDREHFPLTVTRERLARVRARP